MELARCFEDGSTTWLPGRCAGSPGTFLARATSCRMKRGLCLGLLACWTVSAGVADAAREVDLLDLATDENALVRVYGSVGDGHRGVPVAGGHDVDGDGLVDFAMAAMTASPVVDAVVRPGAGEVYLVFGDGTGGGSYDTAVADARILRFVGVVDSEAAGSEIWMDDVTGDGLGDLLIARQNYTPDAGRIGAGALTIVVGGPELRAHAATLEPVDLGDVSSAPRLVTFVGASQLDRLGIWMRTGDVTGDGIADIVVGADQYSELGETHRGAVYVIRGGPHLAVEQTIDLADFGTTALPGDIARVRPPVGSAHYHFGATCQIADLDGNGRAEVLIGAALNRSGAGILAAGAGPGTAHGTGGALDGTLYIAWDNLFSGDPWANGLDYSISDLSAERTIINGGSCNVSFGEEILGGLDYNADGAADLFVGDIVGNCGPTSRVFAGSGHVIFDAATLKGLSFDLDSPPLGLQTTAFFGGEAGDIAADTAIDGDFDADGIADLSFSSPHASPLGRDEAGVIHIFFGSADGWPAEIDLLPGALPPSSEIRITQVFGAHGTDGTSGGDTLAYSAAAGDVNGDGRVDLITNEMLGDGVLPATEDVGNLIVISGTLLARVRELPALAPLSLAVLGMVLVGLGARLSPKRDGPRS